MRFSVIVLAYLLILPALGSAAVTGQPPQAPSPQMEKDEGPHPFGAEFFQGNFAKGTFDELNADYQVMPGDRVAVRLWGARSFEGVFSVDAQGNLFLPEVGPVPVAGVRHGDLAQVVRQRVRSIYTDQVEIYTNLINAQPVAVFVTGFVKDPGRYAGGPTDSILFYLDQAGGIDSERGSYRDIRILRNGQVLDRVDLYPFILEGALPRPRLQEGDVILVKERGSSILAEGNVRHKARFEFLEEGVRGEDLVALAAPLQKVSHVSIVGTRRGAPYNLYIPIDDFYTMPLEDGDTVHFHADTPGDTIMVAADGAIVGASRYPVRKDTRLRDLLHHIPVEPELANLEGIHIKRRSVAERQKKALEDALQRLEQSALTATSASMDEANIRVREAELISKFVAKARTVEPDGTVVVGRDGHISDIYLENGDVIVIPPKSDVVLISGEVMMPQAIVYREGMDTENYVSAVGGFTERADKKNILVVKPNGEVLRARDTVILSGDQILVLPRVDTKNLQALKDISQILYQIAVATKVALDL